MVLCLCFVFIFSFPLSSARAAYSLIRTTQQAASLCVAEPDKQRTCAHPGSDCALAVSVARGLAAVVTLPRLVVLYDLEDDEEDESDDSDGSSDGGGDAGGGVGDDADAADSD